MDNSLFYNAKVDVLATQVVRTDSVTCTGVDMTGYEGVAFVAAVKDGAVYAGLSVKAQQDSSSTFNTAADIEGSSISFGSITGIVQQVLDIKSPSDRYVRAVVVQPGGSATCIVTVTAIRYGARINPQANSGEYHVNVAEGTA